MLSDIVQGYALSHVKSNQKKPEYHDKTEDTEYKVLFTSSKVCSGGVNDSNCNGPNSTKDEGKVIGSIKKDEKGNVKSITESEIIKLPAHDIMASYYLGTLKHNKEKNRLEFKGPDTLQLGSGDVWVFRVLPGMTLTDYENLEPPSNYVDPFKPFNDESGGIIVKKSSGESETHKMLSDKLLSDAKRGAVNDDDFKETIQNFYECKSRDNGLCNDYSKPGLCPVGMIATKNDNGTIACHPYISNPHRAGCYTPESRSIIKQPGQYNSIASGSGNTINEQSKKTGAKGRLGCLNGFRLENEKGLLSCKKATNIAGTSIKHCRARGLNKYGLVPVFKDGKLSFECQQELDGRYYGRTCIDVTSDNVVGFSAESCKMNSVSVTPGLLSISKDSSTGVALKNLSDDNVSKVCKRHNISEVVDELGRKLNINRMTTMFLVNDCFTCL